MKFEWDENKNQRNKIKHHLPFEEAVEIFDHPRLDTIDKRKFYGEKRIISTGRIGDIIIVVVVHTTRGDRIRIISARTANRNERRRYYAFIKAKN